MKDRAMQALHLLALEPIAETAADPNSNGFRPKRSTADARQQCFNTLCQGYPTSNSTVRAMMNMQSHATCGSAGLDAGLCQF